MTTLELIPSSRLQGYIATNGIIGLALDRLPNGRVIPAEVRRDELGEHRTPYLDLSGEPSAIVKALAERCGLPILAGKAATREEIAFWHSHCQSERLDHLSGKVVEAVDKKEQKNKEIAEAHKLLDGKKAKKKEGAL